MIGCCVCCSIVADICFTLRFAKCLPFVLECDGLPSLCHSESGGLFFGCLAVTERRQAVALQNCYLLAPPPPMPPRWPPPNPGAVCVVACGLLSPEMFSPITMT